VSEQLLGIIMLALLCIAIMIGFPTAFTLMALGVIFGYLGFLMLAGWYARSPGAILLSVLVTAMWGGMVLGVMPGQMGISWQAHLGGFLGGFLAARAFRTTPRRKVGAGGPLA